MSGQSPVFTSHSGPADRSVAREAARITNRNAVKRWRLAHPEMVREQRRRSRERNREKRVAESRAYNMAHRDTLKVAARTYYANHIDDCRSAARTAAHRRREASTQWTRVAPWPDRCGFCGDPFVGAFPAPLSETLGHEPPIAWLRKHPEYAGPRILRPEHWACNRRKWAHPDWEVAA